MGREMCGCGRRGYLKETDVNGKAYPLCRWCRKAMGIR